MVSWGLDFDVHSAIAAGSRGRSAESISGFYTVIKLFECGLVSSPTAVTRTRFDIGAGRRVIEKPSGIEMDGGFDAG